LFGRSPLLADLLALAGEGNRPPPLVARSGRLDRTLRLNAARIPSAAPTRSVVVLVEDVTDEQSMEAQLIQSEKLAAVGQLVSGVAHELNNPLTSIAGLSELLLEQREGGPKDRDHLQVIHEQAERAGRIVRNLLTFARPGSGDALPVDIGEVVRRTLQLMSYDLRIKNIRVVQDLAPELPAVLGDRNALQQVVLNLLSNAAHAVQHLPAEAVRTITVRTWADTQVHLRVADTGPGVAETIAPQIFTPFFTTKEPGQGTGLGLSITYSILETHRGHIVLEPGSDRGAAFRVDLPLAPVGAPPPPEPAPAPTPKPEAPRRILLVDEDPAVGRLVRALFAREGHTVEVEGNATRALDAASRGWDLVIADGRATTQGRLFVEELLERHPDLRGRTLVATGDVRPSTEAAVNRLGLPYLRKPFNLRFLRDEASRLWAPATLL
jgi:two-component system NtrC family sensor kinase